VTKLPPEEGHRVSDRIEQLQYAVFVAAPPTDTALSMWSKLFGSEPAGFGQLPPPIGGTQANGSLNGDKILIQVQPSRIDFQVSPLDNPGNQQAPAFSNFRETERHARELVMKALPFLQPVRIAVIISAFSVANDTKELLNAFGSRFPGMDTAPHATELFFQLIQVIPGKDAQGGPLTRIRRWQTQERQLFSLDLARLSSGPIMGTKIFVLARYIDVSSQMNFVAMSAKRSATVLNAVVSDAINLLEHDQ